MKKFYVVKSDSFDPYFNLALEEFLLNMSPEQGCILYLWQNQHTVVIGRNQNPWAECRISLLEEEDGHLARRLSGGGAVYHDLGNLNFTFLCTEDNYDLNKQLSVIKRAVELAGIQTEFSGRNDILAEGRKFSGNAFYHKNGFSYHHGTILIQANTERMQRYLSPPKAKLESKGVASVRSRVINLTELSPSLTCEKMKEYVMQAFGEIYGQWHEYTLLPQDIKTVQKMRSHYAAPHWLLGKTMTFSCRMDGRLSFGHLELLLQIEGGVIQDLQAYTDAMDADLPQKITAALKNCPLDTASLKEALSTLEIGTELYPFISEQI